MYPRSRSRTKALPAEAAHSPMRGLLIAAPIAVAFWALVVEAARFVL